MTRRARGAAMLALALLVVSPWSAIAQVPPPPGYIPPPVLPRPSAPPAEPQKPDPLSVLGQLDAAVAGLQTNRGIRQSLSAKLRAVRGSLASEDKAAVVNQLEAFVHEVTAQTGKHLTAAAAQGLAGDALLLIELLQQEG